MERLGMRYLREIVGTGLIEGLDGVHEGALFALYASGNPDLPRAAGAGAWLQLM